MIRLGGGRVFLALGTAKPFAKLKAAALNSVRPSGQAKSPRTWEVFGGHVHAEGRQMRGEHQEWWSWCSSRFVW